MAGMFVKLPREHHEDAAVCLQGDVCLVEPFEILVNTFIAFAVWLYCPRGKVADEAPAAYHLNTVGESAESMSHSFPHPSWRVYNSQETYLPLPYYKDYR